MHILILSDIHSNLEAFEAVLADAGAVDQVWCLGDVVGYGPDPNACVERLRSLPHRCIAGNHDWATLGKLDLADFNPDARRANQWNRAQLAESALSYLHELEETWVDGPFTLVHGSPRYPIWEYILDSSTARANFKQLGTPFCFTGHTHTPAVFRLLEQDGQEYCEMGLPPSDHPLQLGVERLIINVGSVGQPRDGDPRASYMLLDTSAMMVQHRRIAYPVEETQAKMMKHGLPDRLVVRLSYGW